MAIFTIKTPDGRELDIEAADESTAVAGAKDWVSKNPKKSDRELLKEEVRKDDSFGSRFRRFSDQVMDPFGLFDEISGAGAAMRATVTGEDAGAEYTKAAEQQLAQREVAREANGWTGTAAEVVGGMGLGAPKLAAPVVQGAWNTLVGAAKAGAGGGAVAGAGQAESRPGAGLGEAIADRALGAAQGGAIGAVAGPVVSNVIAPAVARTVGGAKSAYDFAKRQLAAAQNPEQAAIDSVADQMLQAGTDPTRLRQAVSPPPSGILQGRGMTEEDMADLISRIAQGEDAGTVASAYGISERVARKYFKEYKEGMPTPSNMLDLAVEEQGYQGAMPMLRRARANYVLAPDANIAQTLENRQVAQPGRVSDMIRTSKATTHDGDELGLDDTMKYLTTTAKAAERQAYADVYAQQQDIDVSGVIKDARRAASRRQGEIGQQMNKAIDLFFEPEMRASASAPMSMLRLQEAGEKLRRLEARYAETGDRGDYLKLARQRRLHRTLEAQEDFTHPLKQVKVGTPIKDVRRFVDARQELDQMIKRSKQDGQDTPLTGELTKLRQGLNFEARKSNQALTVADARFHDDRTVERLIEEGQKLGVSLNPRSREAMREFGTLTPVQQGVVRTAFEDNLANIALNTTDGNAAAKRFQSEGFRQLVEAFYPKSQPEVYRRGQALIKRLKRESITTNTGQFVTNSRNSPTALIASDVDSAMQNAAAAADLATGRFGKLLERVSDKLAKQYGAEAAGHQLRIVTETDPAKLLPLLRRLEASFATASQRQGKVHDARALRSVNRPAVALGVGTAASGQYNRPAPAR
jgi:hypothetical protein